MYFDEEKNQLLGENGDLIKQLVCQVQLSTTDLSEIEGSLDKHCLQCDKRVHCTDGMSEPAVRELLAETPDLCIFGSSWPKSYQSFSVYPLKSGSNIDAAELRIVKTARNLEAINAAAQDGYWPLIKRVVHSPDIREQIGVSQNIETGEIRLIHDYRSGPGEGYEMVLPIFLFYPNPEPNPFAAYLIPNDLTEGETVWLEDLIEDVPLFTQQDARYRLPSCKGTWVDGDFELDIPEQEIALIG